jgi:hypothetical protein
MWLILLWCALLAWYGWVTVTLLVPIRSAGGFYGVWFVLSLVLWVVSGIWLVGTSSGRFLDLAFAGSLAALVALVAMTQNHGIHWSAGHLGGDESTAMLVVFLVTPWVATGRVMYLLQATKGSV